MKLDLHTIGRSVIKGELQCKTTQKEVKEGAKTSLSYLIVFLIDPSIKRIKKFS